MEGTRTEAFELSNGQEIELEISFYYHYDGGRYYGRPEDCYPAEEEEDLTIEEGWQNKVRELDKENPEASIAHILEKVSRINVREWAEEDAQGRLEAAADAAYEQIKEDLYFYQKKI